MNILKNRTILGLACIVLSLIICFGLTPLFNSAVNAQVDIIRMTKDVKQGDLITADMVAAVKVGGYNLPVDVIREKDNIIGKYARHDMVKDDYILPNKLSDIPLAEFIYLNELDGTHEAISITIKSFAAGLSGKLESGDIISIIASDVGDFRETVAPPELRYVKVLAVTDNKGYDKEYEEKNKNDDEEKQLPSTVTLLVVPEQSVILAELEATGRIHCTLVYRGTMEICDKFLKTQYDFIFPPDEENDGEELRETGETNETEKVGGFDEGQPTNESHDEDKTGLEVLLPNGQGVTVGGE